MNTIEFLERADGKPARWRITAAPHIIQRAKRIFPKILASEHDHVHLTDNLDNARDLWMLCDRYDFDLDDDHLLRLQATAEKHQQLGRDIQKVITGTHVPHPTKLEMQVTPREYQNTAADLCATTGRLLLGDMVGLGKTISSITMLAKTGAFPCLLVVPTHMPTQWKGQLDRCLPGLYVHILKSGQAKPWKKGRIPDVIISNYHKLHGWAQALTPHIKSIIFDEVQELRHHGSDKYKAAEHLAHNSTAQYRMGLSATPIHNYGGEMFNVLNILEEGCLGDRYEFYREYCSSMNGKQLIRDPSAFGTYLRDTGLMLRRTRAEVGRELEDLQNIIIDVEVDMDCIKAVEDISVKLARILTNPSQWRGDKMHAGGELSYKLREATGLAKAKFVADFVTTLVESGEKVLLYGWHRKVYTEWKLLLHQFNPAFYTGKESTTVKEHELGRFLDPEGDCQVMIMSLRSGQGVDGIQFVCSTVVYGEIDWSPAVHIQGTGRAHRDGQPNPVIAYYPLADVGSDPVVSDTLGVKKAQLVGIVDPHFTPVEHTDPNHMRKLALSILKQRGEHIDPFLEMEILSDG